MSITMKSEKKRKKKTLSPYSFSRGVIDQLTYWQITLFFQATYRGW